MNQEDEKLLEAGKSIRSHLPELIPDEAEGIDEQLAGILNSEKSGAQKANALVSILRRHEQTREWLAGYLDRTQADLRRAYIPGPPGNPVPVSAQKYICPQGDFTFYQVSAGSIIPKCPTHRTDLVAAP